MPEPANPRGSGGGAPGRAQKSAPGAAVTAVRMEALTVWVIERVAKFAREHRFTVGDRWIETMLEVTGLLVDASFTADKLPLLAQASRGLTRAHLLCRLATQLRQISNAQCAYFGDEATEIGKMLGGWTRTVRSR